LPIKLTEEIKAELSAHYKIQQPVLLNGEDHVGCLDVVQEVHNENVGVIDLPDSEIFLKEIGEQLSKAVYDELNKRLVAQGFDISKGSSIDVLGDTKVLLELDLLCIEIDAWDKARNLRIQEGHFMTECELNAFAAKGTLYQIIVENESKVREYFKSTDKAYLEIDCELDKGMEIYNFLVKKIVLGNIEIPHASFLKMSFFSVPIYGSILFDFKGTVFLRNLYCDPCSEEDEKYYRSLGNIIRNRRMGPEDNLLQEVNPINSKEQYDVSTNWIVIYTDDLNAFQESLKECFVDQFELISLEGEKTDSVPDIIITESERRGEGKDEDLPLYKKTPVGAKWQDLTMAFPNHLEEKVDILFKGKEKDTVPLKDLGFTDSRATKTFKPLESLVLLKLFAKDKNKYSLSLSTDSERGKLHAQVDLLRNILKRYFGIDSDPVPANEKGGYRLLFTAYCYDIEEKKELDTYIDSLDEYIRELKTEASNSEKYRDNDNIIILKQSIVEAAKEIVQRTSSFELKDVICTECHQKIPIYILNNDNIHILCNDCTPETTNEYESKSVVDFKDNDIPRSDHSS